MRFTFPKKEHLCGENRISRLFEQGKAFIVYPFRVVYLSEKQIDTSISTVEIMISVPKRKHRRANVRNRLKRLTRESYRLNKHTFIELVAAKNVHLLLAFQYISEQKMEFAPIEKKMKEILTKITEKILVDDTFN